MTKEDEDKIMPNKGESVYNLIDMARGVLSGAIDNYQNVFGIQVDVYRIVKREQDKLVDVWGPGKVSVRHPKHFKFYKTIRLLTAPTEFAEFIHQNKEEIDVKLGTNELVIGDLLRIPWVDNQTLDYFVAAVPQTVAGIVYKYHLVSQFNIDTLYNQAPAEEQKHE